MDADFRKRRGFRGEFSGPVAQAVRSRRAARVQAAWSPSSSSAASARRWAAAIRRRVARNSASPAVSGGSTTTNSAGCRDSSPSRAPAAVKTNERRVRTSPAKLSRAISTWFVSRETAARSVPPGPCRAWSRDRSTARRTSPSRSGSVSPASSAKTPRITGAPSRTAAAATPSQSSPRRVSPARKPWSTEWATP
ncbi:hypothetical protein SFUMM280S_07216 [Streptomyces fumanus]